LIAHGRSRRGSRRTSVGLLVIIAATAVLAGLIRAVARTRIGMGRLGCMRTLIVGVIIRRGALKTDTFIMLSRGDLPLCVIRLSSRWIGVGVRRRSISVRRSRRVVVLGLSMRSSRSKRLSMGTVQHRRRFTFPGVMLSVLAGASIGLTSDRSSRSMRPVDSIGRDKGSLRGDRVEEALLVEPDAILATSVWRAVVA
jgi:hypothetical protein